MSDKALAAARFLETSLCGGREQLKEKQFDALLAAINGMMIGGYLTTPGNEVREKKSECGGE
ncbi:hypothetical protein PTH_0248 [Pelotomaculum thermopropionicum SI]|uniref:Biotin and thiamin synthesis-associated domain-containing protein n=1 Tax=Pelotomaculum thermopropionicum (strain DSM 13744 / JCM 10971 / SI) TaxID=370438 RepID=A5D5N9_PELTS|nr:hypothetical protein PTH_0248 [Pelotomaculum thermopropionicum SI]